MLSFHWWNGRVHLSDVRSACAKAADLRFYCFCTIYVLITLEVPLLSVSNFCQDSKWKCAFDVLPKKGGIRSITCCCVWTHHYHHKGSGLVCSAGFFRRMRAPELAHGCGACASCHRCSWTLVDTNSYLSFLKVVRVETQAGRARFVILVPSSSHVWCFLVFCNEMKKNRLFAEKHSRSTQKHLSGGQTTQWNLVKKGQ